MFKNTLLAMLLAPILSMPGFGRNVIPSKQRLATLDTASNTKIATHTLFTEPDDGEKVILNALDTAQSSIDLKMYLLISQDIINHLIQAAKRPSVKVRVMLEQHPYGGGTGNDSAFKALQAAGIQVKWTNPVFIYSHEKSFVVDGKAAFIMTLNMTSSAFKNNREYGIITTNQSEVKEVLDCFNADWNRTGFVPPANSSLVWSNSNSRQKILALIDSAKSSIAMQQEEIQDPKIQQHLVNAVKNKVQVLVLVAAPQVNGQTDKSYAGEKQIKDGGGQVRLISKPYMHAKIYLVDNAQLFIGSENVSTGSLDSNRELGIILTDTNIIKNVSATFEKDWASGTALS
ncbi:MAG: hypothetical protein HXX08_09655 [Chloroflexi bacterium]|uniref:phospholipase D n=1 Tax=Candidatus Chlorohelix allophototropha TaxID=3003348 RepID=A0A8T7M2C8_9CHLR|nr:hypothetical protein [Chloroflexota bacterium]WJW65509.1 phospholipase D-like domain-containing protein [Chloroflexota bacterium L227-S17]